MPVNPVSDRNDGKPVTSPSPIQGSAPGFETSIESAVDRLDSAIDLTGSFDSIGKKNG